MRPLTQLLYGLSRLALFLLGVTFTSFWLLALDGFDFVEPITRYGTRFIPPLLLPVSAAMVLILVLRWFAKNPDEGVGFDDFFAFLLAAACQIGVLLLYRAQGNEIAGDWGFHVPKVGRLIEKAEPLGMFGVAALQFVALFFYWVADPDPNKEEG